MATSSRLLVKILDSVVIIPTLFLSVNADAQSTSINPEQSRIADGKAENFMENAKRKLTFDTDCKPKADEIIVCARRKGESPYRLPIRESGFDPNGNIESVSRERNRLLEMQSGGTGSCSAAGIGGFTGCMIQKWKKAHQQAGK